MRYRFPGFKNKATQDQGVPREVLKKVKFLKDMKKMAGFQKNILFIKKKNAFQENYFQSFIAYLSYYQMFQIRKLTVPFSLMVGFSVISGIFQTLQLIKNI